MAQNYKHDREAREARARTRAYQARRDVHEHQQKRRVRDNIIAGSGLLMVITLLVVAQVFYFSGGPGTPAPTDSAASAAPTPTPTPPTVANSGDVPSSTIAEGRTWTGTMTLNDVNLGIQLDGSLAPQAVSSTISLVRSGFYTGTSCHRLTNAGFFVLQCGDPAGDGSGGPGYAYGPVENAPSDNVYPAGTIAMARQGDSAFSMGSQFFIVYEDTTIGADTAGGYSVIGTVTSGLEQLKSSITDAGIVGGKKDGAPIVPTTITGVSVQ